MRVLFVGINPGVRSALTGHHFAGYSNRFWKLLSESRLVPEPITYLDDSRLPEWSFGITNLIARPSPGIGGLSLREYVEGWKAVDRKIRRYRPEVLALVGVTLYRAMLPLLREPAACRHAGAAASAKATAARRSSKSEGWRGPVIQDVLGVQPHIVHGARVFVLPNPSGRNANFSYGEMLDAFKALRRWLKNGVRS